MLELPAWELDQWRALWREETRRDKIPHPDRLEMLLATLCALVAGIGGRPRPIEDFMPWRKDIAAEEPDEGHGGRWRASRDAMMALALATQQGGTQPSHG